MKTLFFATIATVQLLTTAAFAGPITSGGGFAVVCRGEDGRINASELLDLYEARNKYHYTLIPSSGSLEGDYVSSVQNTYRLQGYGNSVLVGSETRKNLDLFLARASFLPKGQKLPNLNDLGEHLNAPAGCAIEPLAIWNDANGVIKIDSEIWESLSSLSQAALVQHELAYSYQRVLYEKTSVTSRAFVGTIFSSNAEEVTDERTKNLPLAMAKSQNGEEVYTAFHYEKIGNTLRLYFFDIMNRLLVSKAVADIDLTGIALKQSYSPDGNGEQVIALGNQSKTVRSKIQTAQSDFWEIEFTFVPNQPVKIGLYQKGILLQETLLLHL